MTILPNNSYAQDYATLMRVQHYKIDPSNSKTVYPILLESTPERRAIDAAQKASAQEAQRAFSYHPSASQESNSLYLPNIGDLELEDAINKITSVEMMIADKSFATREVAGRYNDKTTDSLETYLSWLKEYVGDERDDGTYTPITPVATPPIAAQTIAESNKIVSELIKTVDQEHIYFPNISSLTTSMASAIYRHVQDMIDKDQDDGKIVHGFNGDAKTSSIETYREWLAVKAGIIEV